MTITVLKQRFTYLCDKDGTGKLTAEGGASFVCEKCGRSLFAFQEKGKLCLGSHGIERDKVGHRLLSVEKL